MEILANILPWAQLVLAILLSVTILVQHSGTGIDGALGGGSTELTTAHTRRGSEKFMFNATIVLAVLFVAVALVALFI